MRLGMTGVRVSVALAAVLSAGVLAMTPGSAGAAGPFTVNSTLDSGPGTLRKAFSDASAAGGGEIDVQPGLGQITLSTGAIMFTSTGAIVLKGNGVHIDGGGSTTGVIRQTGGAGDLSVDGVTITGSNAMGTSPGAVAQIGTGALTLSNCSFIGNHATSRAGAAAGAALVAPASGGGSLTVTGCRLSNNTATSTTGEIGGALSHDASGSLSITRSALTGNSGTGATGSDVAGGAVNNGGPTSIVQSSITGNHATGINVGGGVVNESGVETTVNSTISGNTATAALGGGANVGAAGGILNQGGAEHLVYVTLTGNTTTAGATHAAANYVNQGGAVTFFGTVVAGGSGGPSCLAVGTTSFVSNGFNLEDDAAASCGFSAATLDTVGKDPSLGALAANGGPGPTQLPQPGSALIDAIPAASCQADGAAGIATDERGVARPHGAGCDIGAVEVAVVTPPPPPPPPPPAPPPPVVITPRFTG